MAKAAAKKSTGTTPSHSPVNPDAAEVLLAVSHLGQRIKRLRLKRSMGLTELGKLTGLSASFLSQLETGRVVPTLRNLTRLALVFNKDLSFFFQEEADSVFRIQRKSDRIRLAMGTSDPKDVSESFSILIPEGGLRPCLAELLPGPDREPFRAEQHPGIEMVYVLSGSLEVTRNDELHHLAANDMLYIDSLTPRTYRCSSDTAARALIISFDAEKLTPRRTPKH